MKKIIAFLLVASFVYAVSYEFLASKPPSRARDFYALLFLQSTQDAARAQEIFYSVKDIKRAHVEALLKITQDAALKDYLKCQALAPEELVSAPLECSLLGFSFVKAAELSQSDKIVLALRYKDADAALAKILFYMADAKHFKTSNAQTAVKAFSLCGTKCRANKLDVRLSRGFIDALEAGYYLDRSVEHIALETSLNAISGSVLKLDVKNLGANAAFFYAMLALKKGNEALAVKGLKQALKHTKTSSGKDKINFWLWLITGAKEPRAGLTESTNINFYTVYFREKSALALPPNYKTAAPALPRSKPLELKKTQDPFYLDAFLQRLRGASKQDLKHLLLELGGPHAEPFRAAVYSRLERFEYEYFINPWKKKLSALDKEYQALILALAKQESGFFPCALSHSYAIGAMQMMPFLIRSIAKTRKESAYLPDFFSVDRILPYAVSHIDYLRDIYKKNPLLIAYAYNGGSGFTNRLVVSKLFKGGKYDPFLSIELVPYKESRDYGKKVLTNYYMYRKILGIPVKMQDLLRQN